MSEATQEGGSVELASVCLSSPPLVSNSRSSNRRRRINPIDLSPRHRIKIFWGGSVRHGIVSIPIPRLFKLCSDPIFQFDG